MKKRLGKIVYWAACFILTSGIATYAADLSDSFHGSHDTPAITGR
ncbi:MAG TPA: hypothetical protein VG891_01655 [Rhizomicrobium sp.]|nr:hypothetical protein [Rhizomicrobium sp.]